MTLVTGQVKWFNSRAGYGFITSNTNEDIFVHQSNICPKINRYRSLVQGEYVEFELSVSNDVQQAIKVTGINDGPLMCDSHLERDEEGNVTRTGPPVSSRGGRGGRGGRGDQATTETTETTDN